jgi:hypothetical protein
MAETLLALAIFLVVGLIVSALIIFAVTRLLGEREGIETAVSAAIVGAIVYALALFFLGPGLLPAIIAGIFWLAALGTIYDMSGVKAAVTAFVVWVGAAFVSLGLPTVMGPL